SLPKWRKKKGAPRRGARPTDPPGIGSETTNVVDRVDVHFAAVIGEVATSPVAAQAVLAVEIVVGADAVVPAFAVGLALDPGQLGLHLGGAIAAACDRSEVTRDRNRADRIGGEIIVGLDLALGPSDGEVVVLHPDRAFALHAEIGVALGPQAAGDGAQVPIRMVQLRIAERAVVGGTARLHDLGRS